MGKKGGWFSAVKKALSPDSKEKKDQRSRKSKKRWFGRHGHTDQVPCDEETAPALAALPPPPRPPPLPPPPPPSQPAGELKLSHVEDEQTKHAYSVAIATAMAAQAAVAAAQAAAEVVRLTSRFAGKSKEEVAAIKIQTAFRGYMARRALRALKGLVRLKNLIQGQSVKRQATTTLQCMQTLARVQSQILARRIRMSEENQALEWLLQQQHDKELDKLKLGDEWNDSTQSREQIEKRLQYKQEAAMRRERALAYAFSHQQLLKNARSSNPSFIDPSNPSWGWSWLERWMAARPWETRAAIDYPDRASVKSTSRTMSVAESPRPHPNRPSTPASTKGRRTRPCSLKGSNWGGGGGGGDEDTRSSFSIQSEQPYFRRHSIGGDGGSLVSSPSVPGYMASTKSAKAKSRMPSPLGLQRNGSAASEKGGSVVSAPTAKKRLSFQGSTAGARRHSGPPRVDIGSFH